MTEKGK